jgi:F420H(2)-dependent quinone reductase
MTSMTEPDPRAAFASMTKALITDFRANGGQVTRGPFAGRPALLMTTTGAKSGQLRLAPVVYSRDGDHYVIVASKGGSPTHPASTSSAAGTGWSRSTWPRSLSRP